MDEQRADTRVITAADTVEELSHYLADPSSLKFLSGVLRKYIIRANIVVPENVDEETSDLLQDMVRKAYEIADKYHGAGIQAWLLCIANNLVKQKRTNWRREQQRVVPRNEAHTQTRQTLSEEEFFDLFTLPIAEERERIESLREDLKGILACLSEDDQMLLNFYLHYGFNHNEIARKLQIKPEAARARYSRSLRKLYELWINQDENRRGESNA